MATWLEDNSITAATGANGTLTKPTGTASGHFLGIVYHLEDDIPIEPPNGFFMGRSADHASVALDQYWLWKRAGGSEGASYVVTHASTWRTGYIFAAQNASASKLPKFGTANQGSGGTATANAITSEANDAFFSAAYSGFDTQGFKTPSTDWTERQDPAENLYVQDRALATAGSSGSPGISWTGAWITQMIGVEDDGLAESNPVPIQTKHNAITASRSPSVTFDFAPLENDIVAFFCSSQDTASITIPSGWSNVLSGTTDVESDSHQLCAVYHRVTAAEASGATVTFTATNLYDATETGNVIGIVIRNVDTTTAIDVTNTTFSNTNTASPHVLQGLTPTVDNGLFMSCVVKDATGAYTSVPSGFQMSTCNTNQGKAVCFREALTQNGVAIANTNITPSAGDEYATISVVWRKATAGGAVTVSGSTGVIEVNGESGVVTLGATTVSGSTGVIEVNGELGVAAPSGLIISGSTGVIEVNGESGVVTLAALSFAGATGVIEVTGQDGVAALGVTVVAGSTGVIEVNGESGAVTVAALTVAGSTGVIEVNGEPGFIAGAGVTVAGSTGVVEVNGESGVVTLGALTISGSTGVIEVNGEPGVIAGAGITVIGSTGVIEINGESGVVTLTALAVSGATGVIEVNGESGAIAGVVKIDITVLIAPSRLSWDVATTRSRAQVETGSTRLREMVLIALSRLSWAVGMLRARNQAEVGESRERNQAEVGGTRVADPIGSSRLSWGIGQSRENRGA